MSGLRRCLPLLTATLFFALCALASPARAGNEAGLFYGEQAIMTGGAVRALVDDGSSLVYNPAGLGQVDATVLNVSLNAFQVRSQTLHDALIVSDGGSFDIQGIEASPVPTSVSITRPFGDWVVALGIFTTNFQTTNFALQTSGRSDGRTFRSNVDVSIKDNSFRAAIGAGRRVSERTTLGFSLVIPRLDTNYSSVFSTQLDGADDEQGVVRSLHTKTNVLGIGLMFGGTFDVGERWKLAAVIESPVFRIVNKSRYRGSNFSTIVRDGTLESYESGLLDERDTINQGAVKSYLQSHLAAAYVEDRWTLSFGGDVRLVDPAGQDGGVEAVFNGRIGFQYRLPSTMALGLGLFTDRTDDSEAEREQFKSLQFVGGSVAFRFGEEHTLPDDSPTNVAGFAVSTTIGIRYAYGSGDFEPTLVQFGVPATGGSTRSRQVIHEGALYIATRFDF